VHASLYRSICVQNIVFCSKVSHVIFMCSKDFICLSRHFSRSPWNQPFDPGLQLRCEKESHQTCDIPMNVASRINEMQFPHLDRPRQEAACHRIIPADARLFLFPQMDWGFRKIALLLGAMQYTKLFVFGIFQLTAPCVYENAVLHGNIYCSSGGGQTKALEIVWYPASCSASAAAR